jgi:hypothetical protein
LIRTRNVIGCLIAVSLLSGCMAYSEVPPAKKYEIGGVFRVEPATLWSAQKNGNSENWTVNGFGLDGITFITNVADGKPVAPTTQDDKAPTFRADMNASDVVDLYEAVLASRGFSQVETRNLRPYTISGNDAFRFDYSGFDGIGLAKRGTVIGLIDAEKGLNLVIYEGASEHYYDASLADAEKVLASLEKI